MDFNKIVSVEVRDGVVSRFDTVWIHWIDATPEQVSTYELHQWEDVVRFSHCYSIEKPVFKIKEDGNNIYDYEDGYDDYI